MSLPEIFFRANQTVLKKWAQKRKIGCQTNVRLEKWPKPFLKFDNFSEFFIKEEFSVFGMPFDYTKEINWHQDIQSGNCFPTVFSKDIHIRDTEDISAKIVWEVNRLQYLSIIAIRYKQSGDTKYIDLYRSICESWIDGNPYLLGVNWYSNIEVNLRLITWCLSWEILNINHLVKIDNEFKSFVENKLLPAIYLHCEYSYGNLSKFSSANNHLISEYAGLFIASSYWTFRESHKWRHLAKKGLEKEICIQHSDNGINKEEAADYIQFVTDFFLLSWIIGEKTNNHFSYKYKERIKKIFEYIYQFTDEKCNIPQYGDDDDGKCFIFNFNENFNNYRSLLISGAILFKEPKYKSKAGKIIDQKNIILFGSEGKDIYKKLKEVNIISYTKNYPNEGHFIFKHQFSDKEIYIHFNAARLGYLSIAAHGHADALSLIIHINGHPFLVDSGTFCYHSHKVWRDYFIGTLSHNTIRIDKKNQAKIGGSTLWLDHYFCSIIDYMSSGELDSVSASHNGYEKNGVIHTRIVRFDKESMSIDIIDKIKITDTSKHLIEIPFHFHPKVKIELINGYYLAELDGIGKITLSFEYGMERVIVTGQIKPILGWYSDSFYKKNPCPVIYSKGWVSKSSDFITQMKIEI